MLGFDSEKGLFHFVFANEDDIYYSDTFIKLNMRSYLYYELRKRGYEYIYFFGDEHTQYKIVGATDEANRLYNKYSQRDNKNSFLKIFGKRRNEDNFSLALYQIIQILNKEKQIAVIFSIDTFNEISNYPNIINELKTIENKNSKSNYMHIILIQSPVITNDVRLKYFIDNKSVFRSELFPDIQRIFNKSQNFHIYDELKNEMGDRVLFLNRLDYDSIRSMICNFMLKRELSLNDDELSKIDDYTDFIYACYNSKFFREDMGGLLPKNPKRMLLDIENELKDRNTKIQIENKIKILKDKYNNSKSLKLCILSEGYKFDLLPQFISYANNPDVIKANRIYDIFSHNITENNIKTRDIKYKLLNIIEQLEKPYINIVDYECPLNQYLDFAAKACDHNGKVDIFTLEKSINAIKYSINRLFSITISESEQDALNYENNSRNMKSYYFDMYSSILRMSWELFDIENKYNTINIRISDLKKELNIAVQEEKKFEIMHSSAAKDIKNLYSGVNISSSVAELSIKQSIVTDLEKSIRNAESTKTMLEQYRDALKKNIIDIENMIENNFAENVDTIQRDMSNFVITAKQKLRDNDAKLREIQDKKIEIDAVMDLGKQMQYDRIIDNAIYDSTTNNNDNDMEEETLNEVYLNG